LVHCPAVVRTRSLNHLSAIIQCRLAVALSTASIFMWRQNRRCASLVSPADCERGEMKALVQEYRAWCAGRGSKPIDFKSFLRAGFQFGIGGCVPPIEPTARATPARSGCHPKLDRYFNNIGVR